MATNSDRIERDFTQRSADDQQAFIELTWCDQCQKENLGLFDPCEYEHAGVVYIEGKCNQCKTLVVTELTDEEF
jgi:hypothetical protein